VGNARERWNFLWTTPSTYTRDDGTSDRGISREGKKQWAQLGSGSVLTKEGQSYLVRAIDPDADTDRLVLLTVLETSRQRHDALLARAEALRPLADRLVDDLVADEVGVPQRSMSCG